MHKLLNLMLVTAVLVCGFVLYSLEHQTRGLERVVAANTRYQAATQHHDIGQPHEQTHLAQRVGDVDVSFGGQGLAGRATGNSSPSGRQVRSDLRAAIGVAGSDGQQGTGGTGSGDDRLFARMGACGQNDAAAPERGPQPFQFQLLQLHIALKHAPQA